MRRAASWSSPTPFPSGFYNDAARRVATVFEKWDCEINPDKRLNHTGLFPCLPFWNTAVYNLFSRFSKDVATRRAASFSVLHASQL